MAKARDGLCARRSVLCNGYATEAARALIDYGPSAICGYAVLKGGAR